MTRNPYPAILLVGPTASGKTPLGDFIAQRGLWGSACVHFDFGANLRAIVESNRPDDHVTESDIEFLRGVLESGALLEDEHFPLASRILARFLAQSNPDRSPVIILNGLPRHIGQARALEGIVDVSCVVEIQCKSDAVLERIRSNIGGDRSKRTDDEICDVRNKLAIYSSRTAPLVDYYRAQGKRIETLEATPVRRTEEMYRALESRGPKG
jgi:adenylate kinase family enzyme